jgi:restriction system protein
MPIPDFESLMLPTLEFAADRNEHSIRETIEYLANKYSLTEEERKKRLPSGGIPILNNRISWTLFYLRKAGLLESTRRGFYRITQTGLETLSQRPLEVDTNYLQRYPSFQEFISAKGEKTSKEGEIAVASSKSPDELLEYSYQTLREVLAGELLMQIKKRSPEKFENLVVELLVQMGYGGSIKEAGEVIGRSGDEGIDGIIKEDILGLDVIYVQAKKWDTTVGRPEVQKFAGALQGRRARKGIFITTGSFSKDAVDFSSKIDSRIVLIDGKKLVDLMIDHNISVSTVKTYERKKIDSDYFEETAPSPGSF